MRRARTLAEALAMLAEEGGARWRPFAGGTDVMVLFEAGKLPHARWVSIYGLAELRGVVEAEEAITIGAGTTYSEVRAHPSLARDFPMLGLAAAETGSIAIQNRGTIGGNIANASPAADTPPALLAYDASLELVSASGSRTLPYAEFHVGYKKMQLHPGELIARIVLPRPPAGARRVQSYRKVGTRRAQAITKVSLAACARVGEGGRPADVRLGLASVAPVPLRARAAEAALEGRDLSSEAALAAAVADARAAVARDVKPIDDIRSSAAYRARVAQNLVEAYVRRFAAEAGGGRP
jgi:CO/xanthine dehydrogenase FAD-binding subunit